MQILFPNRGVATGWKRCGKVKQRSGRAEKHFCMANKTEAGQQS